PPDSPLAPRPPRRPQEPRNPRRITAHVRRCAAADSAAAPPGQVRRIVLADSHRPDRGPAEGPGRQLPLDAAAYRRRGRRPRRPAPAPAAPKIRVNEKSRGVRPKHVAANHMRYY